MPVTISDDLLIEAGFSEREARLEIACRLYDANKLTLPQAGRWAGVSRTEFEGALLERHLPLIRIDKEYWSQELEGLERLRPNTVQLVEAWDLNLVNRDAEYPERSATRPCAGCLPNSVSGSCIFPARLRLPRP
jgi:predicted HTH domain antitoxin